MGFLALSDDKLNNLLGSESDSDDSVEGCDSELVNIPEGVGFEGIRDSKSGQSLVSDINTFHLFMIAVIRMCDYF